MFLDPDEAKMALRTQKVSGTFEKRVPDAPPGTVFFCILQVKAARRAT